MRLNALSRARADGDPALVETLSAALADLVTTLDESLGVEVLDVSTHRGLGQAEPLDERRGRDRAEG